MSQGWSYIIGFSSVRKRQGDRRKGYLFISVNWTGQKGRRAGGYKRVTGGR